MAEPKTQNAPATTDPSETDVDCITCQLFNFIQVLYLFCIHVHQKVHYIEISAYKLKEKSVQKCDQKLSEEPNFIISLLRVVQCIDISSKIVKTIFIFCFEVAVLGK